MYICEHGERPGRDDQSVELVFVDRGYTGYSGKVRPADCAQADSDALRARLNERGGWAEAKPMPNRVNIPTFNPFLYRYRNLVERFFNKIKQVKAAATRFEGAYHRRFAAKPELTKR